MTAEQQSRRPEPERTCAGCKQPAAAAALVRLAFVGERLVPDLKRKLGGRGVSLHPRRSCLELAARRGGFARALRRPVSVDQATLGAMLREKYRWRAEGLLHAAWRAGHLVVGTDAVREALRSGPRPCALVIAADAAGRREELMRAAQALGSACVVYGDKAALGAVLGREEVGVAAMLDDGLASELSAAAAAMAEFSEDE